MWASVSASCGPMCTNCDDLQHAVHPPQGTSEPPRPSIASLTWASQAEKSPAGSSSLMAPSTVRRTRLRYLAPRVLELFSTSVAGGTVIRLESISFNHDSASATHDALNIRRNATTPVTVPEWRQGVCFNPEDSPAGYSRASVHGHKITVQAQFTCDDPTIRS